jgi:hypothetical protein
MLKVLRNGQRTKEAMALVQLRKVWHPDEVAIIVAAADALLAERDQFTRDEGKLLDAADKLRVVEFRATPHVVTPFDAKVAELDEPLAAAVAALRAAEDRVAEVVELQRKAAADTAALAQQRRYGSSNSTATEMDQALMRRGDIEDALLQQRAEAEADLQAADSRWLRLNSKRLALQLAGDRWRSEREYAATCVK